MSTVTTVVVGEASQATLQALGRQTHPVTPGFAGDLAAALALGATGGWLWLLGPGVEPQPQALEHLLAVADGSCGAPSAPLFAAADGSGRAPRAPLLASRPVDAAGRVVEAALPRGDEAGTERLLASVPRGLVPIRQAPLTSLLVDAATARAVAAPDPDRFGAFVVRAWTGRLLTEEPGYLVLASRVRVPPPPRPAITALPALARLRRERLLTRGEAVRIAAWTLGPRGSWSSGSSRRDG